MRWFLISTAQHQPSWRLLMAWATEPFVTSTTLLQCNCLQESFPLTGPWFILWMTKINLYLLLVKNGLCLASPAPPEDKHRNTFQEVKVHFLAANFCIYTIVIQLRWLSLGTGMEWRIFFLNMEMFCVTQCSINTCNISILRKMAYTSNRLLTA